jgi:hypothetical protein
MVQMQFMEDMIDPAGVKTARAPDDPVDFVSLGKQEFREITSVLPGDPGNQCRLLSCRLENLTVPTFS